MRTAKVSGIAVSDKDLISIPEAAKRIGLHPDTAYRLARTGQFPAAIQIGSRWRVSVPRLERWLHGDGHFGIVTVTANDAAESL